jgi:hypothetical protein
MTNYVQSHDGNMADNNSLIEIGDDVMLDKDNMNIVTEGTIRGITPEDLDDYPSVVEYFLEYLVKNYGNCDESH